MSHHLKKLSSTNHVRWDCKYHIVFVPKYRRKLIYGQLRVQLGSLLRELFKQKGAEIIEGFAKIDHVHICASVPPKISLSELVGFVKGKSSILIKKKFGRNNNNCFDEHFWCRGFFVSTIGVDETVIRNYIREQHLQELHRQESFDLKWE